MAYSIIDILNKLIKTEEKIKKVYVNIANSTDMRRIEIISRILVKEKERHIRYYEDIKKENSSGANQHIDFDIYDKISFLINQFNIRIVDKKFDTLEQLLNYALEYEEMNKGLLIDMQGRLLRTKKDNTTVAYKVLSEIIFEREKNIMNIKYFIKSDK
ncbi:hypothetical protein GOQ29_12270 [Clostridium sp. D2Q-14]|uniref:hypothetical protein n=1 Tax=Anaeromonas gelatinilytica TaxID=2683194 RepID=UPI00193B7A9E|nr:hypothetical protein [Anaeromonas gelatinilytica]MBS4536393.1 hypothetical protein [Anaeromonas gelatinilytica]